MKKYVIIPDFVPLYAMRKVFGPQTGPIRKPIKVDTEIIRELLKQKPPVRVFEVKLTNVKLGTYDDKIELTLQNYDKEDLFASKEPEKTETKPDEESMDKESQATVEEKKEEVVSDTATENTLAEPVASDSMGVELRIDSDTDKDTTDTKSDDSDIAELVDAVTENETTAANETTEASDKKSEEVAGAADTTTTTQPLTRAQRRAMERERRNSANK